MRTPIAVALALVLAFGCTDQTTSPTALNDGAAPAPAFNWTNNPDNGNLKIYRDAFDWITCWSDAEDTGGIGNGLRACHGTIPLGDGTETDCGLQQNEAPVSYQDVGSFDFDDFFSNDLKAHAQGDVWITIRDQNTPGECFGDALVAEGWGHLRMNDNDAFGPDTGGNNANAWGTRGHSNKLEAPDGSRVKYNGHIHYVVNEAIGTATTAKVDIH